MTPQELLSRLEAYNVELAVQGGRLRYRPAGALPDQLREELRAHKAELVGMLKAGHDTPLRDTMPGGVSESQPSLRVADVVAMPLDEFATAGLVVEVQSEVLGGEVVVFASDNARVDPGERRVVYRAAELRELLALRPTEVQSVHRVKKVFGGTVVAS